MRRSLPFFLIAGDLLIALGAGWFLYRVRMEPEPTPAGSTPSPSPPVASPTPTPTPTPTPVTTPVTPPEATTAPTAAETPEASATVASPTPAVRAADPVINYGRPGAKPMHVRGNPGAPALLEEFGDFECLPCSKLFPALETLEQEFGPRLVVVFRQHPLTMHHYALDAARAAQAAGLQGKFWEMHDMLYRNRATWVPAPYVRPYLNEYATALQLDFERFKEDMDGKKVADRIVADREGGG